MFDRDTHAQVGRKAWPVCTQIPGLVWIRLADCARFSKYRKVMKYRERCETFNARSGGLLAPPPSSPFLSPSLPLPTTYIEYTWPCISRASTRRPAWGGADNFFIKKVFRNKNQTRSSVGIDTRPSLPPSTPVHPRLLKNTEPSPAFWRAQVSARMHGLELGTRICR